MRVTSAVTSISWIPSETMSGLLRLPMDIGIGHYDPPPPDRIVEVTLDRLRDADALRFANHLAAWIDVEDGEIVSAGYAGHGIVGTTTADLGLGSVTFPGVAYPLIQRSPVIERGSARFVQTAGGRTGAPCPHRVSGWPYVRISGPTAWTTLALRIRPDGSSTFDLVGASPFPRHWVYDGEGRLRVKSGLVDFSGWAREHDHERSPWHDVQRQARVVEAETATERAVARQVMAAGARLQTLAPDTLLTMQGEPGDEVYLVLDGVLQVDVDGEVVAEIGPGAVVGERAGLEGRVRTATVRAVTAVRVAVAAPRSVGREQLADIAVGHRREAAQHEVEEDPR